VVLESLWTLGGDGREHVLDFLLSKQGRLAEALAAKLPAGWDDNDIGLADLLTTDSERLRLIAAVGLCIQNGNTSTLIHFAKMQLDSLSPQQIEDLDIPPEILRDGSEPEDKRLAFRRAIEEYDCARETKMQRVRAVLEELSRSSDLDIRQTATKAIDTFFVADLEDGRDQPLRYPGNHSVPSPVSR